MDSADEDIIRWMTTARGYDEASRREGIARIAFELTDEGKRDRLRGIEHLKWGDDIANSWTIACSIDTKFRCAQCGVEILEGAHYVIASAWTATRMPADYVPVVPLAQPPELEGIYCSPAHLLYAVLENPEMRSTFG